MTISYIQKYVFKNSCLSSYLLWIFNNWCKKFSVITRPGKITKLIKTKSATKWNFICWFTIAINFEQRNVIVWTISWVFVSKLSGSGFDSSCSHLNFRFRVCFQQGVPWHSGYFRVWIHSETRTYSQMLLCCPSDTFI